MNRKIIPVTYRNSEVKVTLEFPQSPELQTESEFISRLKELYLRKIDADIIAGERLRTVNKSSIPVSNSQAGEDGSNE